MRKTHQEDVRKKIQTSQLVNRLTDHVLGTVEMTPTQVQAANILLKKALPDLQSVEHTGEGGGPVDHSVVVRFVKADGAS
jgi:hypothetical protein